MHIGFFGGSFDPPHRGHIAIAQAAADHCGLSRVLLAPTAHQPLKPQGHHAPYADRLAMVRLLCAADPRLEASTADAPRPDGQPNYTLDTLRALQQTLPPDASLVVIVGIDAFLQIQRWHEPHLLLRDFNWAVISRPGSALADIAAIGVTPAELTRVQLLDGISEPASATAIREALQHNRNPDTLLPPTIITYIHTHHLYQ